MKVRTGIQQSLQRRFFITKNRIKYFGEPRVITIGISNFCSDFKWHLFYDIDKQLTENQQFKINICKSQLLCFGKTKQGCQILDLKCRELVRVKSDFDLKKYYPSDYFWSMPLFLRISEKVDENGKVLSPTPENPIPKDILLNHFLDRKLYRTWD